MSDVIKKQQNLFAFNDGGFKCVRSSSGKSVFVGILQKRVLLFLMFYPHPVYSVISPRIDMHLNLLHDGNISHCFFRNQSLCRSYKEKTLILKRNKSWKYTYSSSLVFVESYSCGNCRIISPLWQENLKITRVRQINGCMFIFILILSAGQQKSTSVVAEEVAYVNDFCPVFTAIASTWCLCTWNGPFSQQGGYVTILCAQKEEMCQVTI